MSLANIPLEKHSNQRSGLEEYIQAPDKTTISPAKGLKKYLFTQERIGKGGKPFTVYKLETMDGSELPEEHQNDAHKNGLYGKPVNDPRITPVGKILRKYWIDETPQLFINILYCWNMRLIGTRPLTQQDFNRLPPEHQKKRIKHKPGIIGIVYAYPVKGWDERVKIEDRYLDEKEKHPIWTDIKYLFKVAYNIIIKGARGI